MSFETADWMKRVGFCENGDELSGFLKANSNLWLHRGVNDLVIIILNCVVNVM